MFETPGGLREEKRYERLKKSKEALGWGASEGMKRKNRGRFWAELREEKTRKTEKRAGDDEKSGELSRGLRP